MNDYDNESNIENTPVLSKKLSPLDYQLFEVIYISDDFNEDLGDEFWLGEEYCDNNKEQ